LRKLVAAVYVLSLSVLSLLISSPASAQGTILQVNAGGLAAPPFQGDQGFTASTTISHANAINTTKVINPAPVAVYQTGRIGNFTYTLGGFVPRSTGTVRLHFAETYWTAPGQRSFNVSINGAPVLTNFDIFLVAGGSNIANIQQFSAPANSTGQYVIQFTTLINNSLVNGIEIISSTSCTAPTAPTALTATAISASQINVQWAASSAPCSGITYNVFRGITSGFTPPSSNQITSGVTATSYSDTGLTPSTTYYYLVQAVNSQGSSMASNQASATTQTSSCTTPTAPGALTATAISASQINTQWMPSSSSCSGIIYTIFRSTTSGFTPSITNQITSGVTATSYSDTGLTASTTYYYLVEAVGSRSSSGPSNQAFATTQSIVVTSPLIAISAGGAGTGSFLADQDYLGGTTISHANIINTANVINPAPAAVYNTGRIGNFSYTIGGFKTATNYVVRLHFCETYWAAPGMRVFNASINGTQVLTNFDIFATAGGQNIANIQQFTQSANSGGQFVIQFTTLVNNALINGIEITSASPKPDFSFSTTPTLETVGVGSSATYTVNLSALNGFTGSVAWSASGFPPGTTATFSPTSTTGSANSVLTIATTALTPKGSFPLTITGASGSLTHSATATITVTTSAAVAQIINQMALSDDVTELHGVSDASDYRVVPGISTLGIPLLNITNGPAGATKGGPGHEGPATAMPAPIALAATWDVNLANQYGKVVGAEARDWANGLLEGLDINIARVPQNGRTFEAYGEDPYLVAQMAVANLTGAQSQGIITESKHFAANNQETNRETVNEIIDERTLREIYLPAFEATVKAGVGAVMCAYNKVNGVYMCENDFLLNHILKQEWGFTGFVTSDFGATHSTVASANAGLDLEMPTGVFFDTALASAVTAGLVPQTTINDKLIRRFSTMMNLGVFNNPPGLVSIPSQQDGLISRQIAEAGMVLLQNKPGVLPLSTSKILPLTATRLHRIAVIGPYAGAAMTGGGGSSMVSPIYTVAPITGIQNRVGPTVTVSYNDGSIISTAVSIAQTADVAIVMVGDSETEGGDDSISLSGNQDLLVQSIAAANPNTIVVMKSGTAILMPWAASVPAILQAWYPGEEDGNAVAAVLFGDVNPSGKLPLTFPLQLSDLPANTAAQYPGVLVNGVPTATYSEGIFVGYRHYDQANITPLFPFGFGLSYTNFSFQNLVVSPTTFTFTNNPSQTVTVSFSVTNSGTVSGAEVAQLYLGIPSTAVPEPPKSLQSFQKVMLQPGQTVPVQLTLNQRSFSYWDVISESWKVVPGAYQIMVGDSSRNILLQTQITIN
jgi:beta-glucosidase